MRKLILTLAVVGLMFVLAATAVGFSLSLQNLHVNAASFAAPVIAPAYAAPMTYADESNIQEPQSSTIRFEEYQAPEHVCERSKTNGTSAGF